MSRYFGIIEKFKDSDPASTTSDFKLIYSGFLFGNHNENFRLYFTDNSIAQSIAVSPTGIVHVAGSANTDPIFNIIPLINPDQAAPDSISISDGPTAAFVTALTPYSINWNGPKHILRSATNVDIFDFTTTNNSDCLDNICIWANTREPNVTKSRTHLLLNATTPTWLACDGTTTNKQFSYFGRDRSNGFANPLDAFVPNSLDASAMAYNRPASSCASNPLSGVTNTPIAKYLKTSSDNQYYVQYDNTSTTHDKLYVHTTTGWSSATDIDPTLQSCEFRINAIDGNQTSGKVFAATTNGLYECSGTNYPQCTTWEHDPYFKKGNIRNILYKYDNSGTPTREYLVVATDGDASSTPYPKAGLFLNANLNDGKNTYWSNITPKSYPSLSHPEYDTAVEVVTGLTMDKDMLYISSYSIAQTAIKKHGLKRFLPENIKSNQCNYDNANKLANGIIWAGVTVEQLAPDAKSARTADSASWKTGGTAYQVKRINFNDTNFDLRCSTTPGEITLPISITITSINDTTNRANTIYVPALVLGKCNKGCYWVGGADFSKDEDGIN